MLADADLSAVAELMVAKRASLLLALMGGRPLTAGELADRAGISPSLASAHLAKLLDGGLIAVTQQGRQRHYRLAGPEVAAAVEAVLRIAPVQPVSSLREARQGEAIALARTCYDHLAGAVGVGVTERLERTGALAADDGGYALTARGERRMRALGLDVEELRARRRAFVRPCLDWTERRPHLAGSLGSAIAGRLIDVGWLVRMPGSRALRVTDDGLAGLRDEFGLNLASRG
ncbi:MAG TPA: helix-turn-helix domain-containing protein [Solirubrobacteraceae bacterium]|jgi:DNA-binding transcriptional ArsR family regulator|nr:helix-turn-helix domain-containing protein [Solirubrobacteraceae bacterium]